MACLAGPIKEREHAFKPLHDIAAEHVGQMPYPALNSAFDQLTPPGLQHNWKASFVRELTDEAIDAHLAHGRLVARVRVAEE